MEVYGGMKGQYMAIDDEKDKVHNRRVLSVNAQIMIKNEETQLVSAAWHVVKCSWGYRGTCGESLRDVGGRGRKCKIANCTFSVWMAFVDKWCREMRCYPQLTKNVRFAS